MSLATARALRRNMTDAERRLWRRLRMRELAGCKFRRQRAMGAYVVDFVCLETRLVIEVDGGQHAEQADSDQRRTAWLAARGFRVLRFWNNDVFEHLDEVCETILRALEEEPCGPPS